MQVVEIFESIQGETSRAGLPCAFVRFAGCDRRCRYCDTRYAFRGGCAMSRAEIVAALTKFGARFVTLTGGEPLLQPELPALCEELLAAGWKISVETHGGLPAGQLPQGVARIFDVKTPGSGQPDERQVNLAQLRPGDEVKFVVCSREDFDWSLAVIRRHRLEERTEVLLSPVAGEIDAKDLVRWMLEARLTARLNLQLHKVVWGAEVRGV